MEKGESQILVTSRVRVLESGPHNFSRSTPSPLAAQSHELKLALIEIMRSENT